LANYDYSTGEPVADLPLSESTVTVLGTKATDEATMAPCFEVANAIVAEEMDLHREFAAASISTSSPQKSTRSMTPKGVARRTAAKQPTVGPEQYLP
jgi:hypothetical protein